MVLNYIWIGLFVIGVVVGLFNQFVMGNSDTLPGMMDSTFEMSKSAFEMAIGLTGTLTFWMGIMKIGEDSGMVKRLAKFLSPVLSKLFPEVPKVRFGQCSHSNGSEGNARASGVEQRKGEGYKCHDYVLGS